MSARVMESARVSDYARVSGYAWVSGNAWVSDYAQVSGNAQVSGYAWVSGNAWVSDYARVSDYAWVSGNARVSDYAQVSGNAQVSGYARVSDYAQVSGNAWVSGRGDLTSPRHYLTAGPVGSEDRTVTLHRTYPGAGRDTWGHQVNAGCWSGTLDELAARIASDNEHRWRESDAARWRADYEAIIALFRVRVSEWEAEPLTDADHARWAEASGGAA